jgi:hypothetical protein
MKSSRLRVEDWLDERMEGRRGNYLPPSAHCIRTLRYCVLLDWEVTVGMIRELNWRVGTFGPKAEN